MHPLPRVAARPPLAIRAAVLVAAAALWLYAAPAPAADGQSKADAATKTMVDKMVKSTVEQVTPSPSADVDAATADESDSSAQDSSKRGKRRGARIQIDNDPDFESFTHVMETAPWIVGLIFLVVGSIFLTPVILLVGIIWYKLRKARMQNEAWLKLAEKGVLPPGQAAEAVSSGLPPPETAKAAEAAPAGSVIQQAVATRRRAVWSDLRKGIVMITVGLAFCAYSLFNDAAANWIGLVLLFLGIGYVILWWLEDRHLAQRNANSGAG